MPRHLPQPCPAPHATHSVAGGTAGEFAVSGITGAVRFDDRHLDPGLAARMVGSLAHRGPDGRRTWCHESACLGHAMLWTTPESLHEIQPAVSRDGILALVSDARLDNREELTTALAMDGDQAAHLSDAELILASYQRWAEDCPQRLLGDFAFAIWNKAERSLFCARDPAGVKSLYYYHRNSLFAFASEIKGLFQIPEIPRELNEGRVADHFILAFDDQASTFFRDIYRLLPGHCMSVSARGRQLRRYWSFNPDAELRLKSDGEYEEAFRDLFTEAVRCRLRSAFPVGSTLSGGLDSSSIACTARASLRQEGQTTLHTFSAIFPSLPRPDLKRIDERKYVEAVVAGGDVIAHEVHADRLEPLGNLAHVLWYQDDPLVPFNLYIHLGIFDAARANGVRVVLDGTDGDTTVSHGYERLAELARTLRWGTLLQEARAVSQRSPGNSLSTWRILWQHGFSPVIPAGLRESWNRARGRQTPPLGCDAVVAKDFAHRLGLRARIDRQRSSEPRSFESARRVHLQSIQSPLLPYLLDLADKSAAACSVEARYPFFDRRLMEFCLALPPEQKLQAGWGRSILRRAMQGLLPPEIQWRNTKADLSPNFHRSILGFGKEKLDRLFSEIDGPVVERFLDLSALKVVYQRYQKQPSNSDAMTIFMAATFAKWVGENFRQTRCQTNGHAGDGIDRLFGAETKGSALDGFP